MDKKDYREVLGEKLRIFRKSRGLSKYAVARDGGIAISQVKRVEDGENYTMDIFLGYIVGSNLYMYFSEKDYKGEGHDFDELIRKGIENNPE